MSKFNNPAEKQGLVVTNATLDLAEIKYRRSKQAKYHKPLDCCNQTVNESVLTIQPHDLTFRNVTRTASARSYNDTEIHVTGCTNGMKSKATSGKGGEGDEGRKRKRDELAFAGVAVTKAIFSLNPGNNTHEMNLPTQIGGVCTIQNTGGGNIRVGDMVVWDLPDDKDEGVGVSGHPEKQHFITKPYVRKNRDHCYTKAQQSADWETLARADALEKRGGGVKADKARRAVPEFMTDLYKLANGPEDGEGKEKLVVGLIDKMQAFADEQRSRVIGRALSSAKPGDVFDIVLGHYSA